MTRSARLAIVCAGLFGVCLVGASTHARPAGTAMINGVLTCGGLPVTIVGTNGPDVLVGTAGPDVIAGLGGDDEIYGGGFDDVLCGGPGNDYIEGQQGEDLLFGEQGDDVLDGGVAGCCDPTVDTSDDVISGGPGNDELYCADFPQAGCSLYGEQGDDTIYITSAPQAAGGQNFAFGGNGDDTLLHNAGDAILEGGNGDDLLISLDVGSGADMDGGKGVDSCVGGGTMTGCEG